MLYSYFFWQQLGTDGTLI